jgi:hypothetical protein
VVFFMMPSRLDLAIRIVSHPVEREPTGKLLTGGKRN